MQPDSKDAPERAHKKRFQSHIRQRPADKHRKEGAARITPFTNLRTRISGSVSTPSAPISDTTRWRKLSNPAPDLEPALRRKSPPPAPLATQRISDPQLALQTQVRSEKSKSWVDALAVLVLALLVSSVMAWMGYVMWDQGEAEADSELGSLDSSFEIRVSGLGSRVSGLESQISTL